MTTTRALAAPVTQPPAGWERGGARDRAARGVILAAGALCFALLAWVHLGLGALVAPPAPAAALQTARAGDLRLALALDSGQLTAAGPNTITLTITDQRGAGVSGATVTAHLTMLTMAMTAPDLVAAPEASGRYALHPVFAMAGSWRLSVTIERAGHTPLNALFGVTARWG